jgi:transcriptional regulator with XRE-family HTH domain
VLTLRELGEKAGVSKDTISRIEREGTAYPATIRKLAKALDIDASELVPEEE